MSDLHEIIEDATKICANRNKKMSLRTIPSPAELRNGAIHSALDTIKCSMYSLTAGELIKILDNMLQDHVDELKSIKKRKF